MTSPRPPQGPVCSVAEPSCEAESLPPHRVRVSARAKRCILRVTPGLGLEVVLPRHMDPAQVPDLLRRHRAWIDKHLARAAADSPSAPFPGQLILKGGREIILLEREGRSEAAPVRDAFCPTPGGLPAPRHDRAHPAPGTLSKTGPPPLVRRLRLPAHLARPQQQAAALHWLREWVRAEAHRYLAPLLHQLAQAHGFSYGEVRIRFQRSRWGSCSGRKNLSLNAGLLFLPEALTRHILLHELCHTRHMNHSAGFWQLLFSVEPDALAKDKALRHAWKYVPGWLYAQE